ncbi:Transmembrane protein [Novosphingobium lubricantis]
MQQLTAIELANWMALYLAASICCVIALVLSCATVVVELYRERCWATVTSVRAAVLFVPRTWWRWQKHYLTSMPVTLGVVILFAGSMNWS